MLRVLTFSVKSLRRAGWSVGIVATAIEEIWRVRVAARASRAPVGGFWHGLRQNGFRRGPSWLSSASSNPFMRPPQHLVITFERRATGAMIPDRGLPCVALFCGYLLLASIRGRQSLSSLPCYDRAATLITAPILVC